MGNLFTSVEYSRGVGDTEKEECCESGESLYVGGVFTGVEDTSKDGRGKPQRKGS